MASPAFQIPADPPKPPPYNGPPYGWREFTPKARLLYLRTVSDTDREILQLYDAPVVGFDMEWRPNFKPGLPENPVALIQLASEEKILLIQVSAMPGFPPKLRDFLESSRTLKAGVGIQHDARKLFKDYGVDVYGCIDLSLLARSVDSRWKGRYQEPIGLARLAETYLDRKLLKGNVQSSNWEARLWEKQQDYAANDGQSGLIIYQKLLARAPAIAPFPDIEYYSFNVVGGVLRDPSHRPWFPFNPTYDPGPPPVRILQPTADGPRIGTARRAKVSYS